MATGTAELLFHPSLLPPLGLASVIILALSLFILYLRQRGSIEPAVVVKVNLEQDAAAPVQDDQVTKQRYLLLYGTQTGTAERFSKQLKAELQVRYGNDCAFDVMDAEDYKTEERLAGERLVFLLLATYGDGEPTDDAADLYNWVVKAAQEVERGDGEQLLKVRSS